MNFAESFLTALDGLLANKMRSVLTMLGVIIGVAAVIALMSIGNGLNASITDEITSIGTNLLFITTDYENSNGVDALSMNDVAALSDSSRVPAVAAVSASVSGDQEIIFGGRSNTTAVTGVTLSYFPINNLTDMAAGDSLTQQDIDTSARVTVLGLSIANDLFGNEYPIGQSLKINGASYEVVGVLAEQGDSLGSTPDDTVFIPISTAQSRLYPARTRDGSKAVRSITAQAVSAELAETAVEQISEVLREAHDIAYASEDDFTILSQTELLSTFDTITATITAFLGAIAGISLLVGGIGIMNIMLVSVTERTREIGIRKAVGALKRDILAQFLIESLFLSLLGGFIGIIFGFLLSYVASQLLDFAAIIDAATVALATTFAAGVGLLFGIYPAWRAAGLRPIEALRYE